MSSLLLIATSSTSALERPASPAASRRYSTLIGKINLHQRGQFSVFGCQVPRDRRVYFKVSSVHVPLHKTAGGFGFFWALYNASHELAGQPITVRDDRTVDTPVSHSNAGYTKVGFGVIENGPSVSSTPLPIGKIKSC